MIKVYLDWNVMSGMKNNHFQELNDIILNREKFLLLYSTSHIGDIFESINKYDPELFVWLGDATYIDDLVLNLFLGFKPVFNREYSQMKFNLTYHENFYSILRKNKP